MDDLWKYKIYAAHTVAAAGSVALGTAITYPLDTIKVLVQVGSGTSKSLTAAQALERVRYLSGYSGLFNGFGWLACGRVLGMGARFGTYEFATAYCKDGRPWNYITLAETAISGTVAGAAESLITVPFELFKIRSQAASAFRAPSNPSVEKTTGVITPPVIEKLLRGYMPDKKALNYHVNLLSILSNKPQNMASALQGYPWMMSGSGIPPSVVDVRKPSQIVSLEGWSTLLRGLRPGIVRDSVFGGIFFSSWHFLHLALADWRTIGSDTFPRLDEPVKPISTLQTIFAAGVSGSVAAVPSHIFDTAKSRSLCTIVPKFISLEKKYQYKKKPGTFLERQTGIHPTDKNVLFKGIWLRMARCGIGSMFIVSFYFLAVDGLLTRGNRLT